MAGGCTPAHISRLNELVVVANGVTNNSTVAEWRKRSVSQQTVFAGE